MFELVSRSNHARSQTRINRITKLSLAVLVVVLLVFFVIVLHSANEITSQANRVNEGPYPVSVQAGHAETLLVQSRTLANRLTLNPSREAVESVVSHYESINPDLYASLKFVAEHHDMDPTAAQLLLGEYDDLVLLQQDLVNMVNDPRTNNQEVAEFVESHLDPTIAYMLALDTNILSQATEQVEELNNDVRDTSTLMVVISIVLMAVVVATLAINQFALNVTRRREAILMENLQSTLEMAQNANEAKSRFLSNMSHDIRTPMNAIIGLTAIARSHVDDRERVADCLQRIDVSSRQLLNLINDVLDMSKIENGKIALADEAFQLDSIIADVVTIAQTQANAKGIDFDVVTCGLHHEQLIGDGRRLAQVLQNLLSNAIKYTPENGSARLTVSEMPGEQPDACRMTFQVQDNGIGMSEEFLSHIFDAFEREHNDTTDRTEGAGLGMAIVHSIITMMGGTIDVESKPNVGSTFTVTLPFKCVEPEPAQRNLAQGKRVLLAESNLRSGECVACALQRFGMDVALASTRAQVVAAASGKAGAPAGADGSEGAGANATAGADAANENAGANAAAGANASAPFDLILFDWREHDPVSTETAQEMAQALADAGFDTPIVLFSTIERATVEDALPNVPVTAVIDKPLFASRLETLFEQLWGESKAETVRKRTKRTRALEGRVLLVEDNEINRIIATELIGQMGPVVETACDGQEAVELVKSMPEGHFDLVFMDMQMPRLGGGEATEAIREFETDSGRARLPIVAMTANAFTEDRNRALRSGMDGFTTKPIDLVKIEEVLQRYLG